MNQKLNLINQYIDKCDSVILNKDMQQACQLFLEIQSIYESEIPNFWNGLKSEYGRATFNWEDTNPFWLVDLPILKAKLKNYAATLTQQQVKASAPPLIVNNTYATANSNASVYIDFETDIKVAQYTISEMASLSDEDTKCALQKLDELHAIAKSNDSRKTKWQKVGSIFKWLADKSIDLAVAFAPALMNVIRSL